MDRFESAALDRHITGNGGEDSVPDDDAAEEVEPFPAEKLQYTIQANASGLDALRAASERFRVIADQARGWAAPIEDVAEDIARADRPHAFVPRLLANDSPTLMCRVCGEFYDDERHRPADDPDDPRAAFLDDARTYYGTDGERVHDPREESEQ
jgi:hypothetical protein